MNRLAELQSDLSAIARKLDMMSVSVQDIYYRGQTLRMLINAMPLAEPVEQCSIRAVFRQCRVAADTASRQIESGSRSGSKNERLGVVGWYCTTGRIPGVIINASTRRKLASEENDIACSASADNGDEIVTSRDQTDTSCTRMRPIVRERECSASVPLVVHVQAKLRTCRHVG